MQNGREAGGEVEEEDEAVFLSPEWDPTGEDQGASPKLRRSARKRKSTAGGDDSMVNSASKKKKKVTPEKMPKVTRSPPRAAAQTSQEQQGQSFEALLLAMEGRLTAKMEKANEAAREAAQQARLNCEGLEQLESRVDANEECLMTALRETEARIMARVDKQVEEAVSGKVKEMVDAQLLAAGFDQNLTAADMSVRSSIRQAPDTDFSQSYARAAAAKPSEQQQQQLLPLTKEDRREVKFNLARKSLRLWPIEEDNRQALDTFLLEKLRLERDFVKEEMGEVIMRRVREPRNKNKNEYVVTFETKQLRDAVKSAAPNLANFRENAGMRLHIPDHLQKDFHSLMNLSFDLKRKHPRLKRNIKFDEEDGGLFMDFNLNNDDENEWKRVKPAQAERANKKRKGGRTKSTNEEELEQLLGNEEESDK